MTDETQKRIPPEVFARRRRTRAPGQTIVEPAAQETTEADRQAERERIEKATQARTEAAREARCFDGW